MELVKKIIGKMVEVIKFYGISMTLFFNKKEARCSQILALEYGHLKSVKSGLPIDKNNLPIPWYTYPAIEFIGQLDLSSKSIFEYGSGNSSLFWGRVAKKVVSVEHSKQWYEKTKPLIKAENEIHYFEQKEDYLQLIHQYSNSFDIVIIDAEYRLECAMEAIKKLSEGGLIILDNSDWYVHTAKYLRENGFIQVDMSGFGPINAYTWTTSFFFSRNYAFLPKKNQPEHSLAAEKHICDS